MPKSTNPITYRYNVDGRTVDITRRHVGTAYAKNGNTHNPTEYFTWHLTIDGAYVMPFGHRAEAYEWAAGFGYCADDGKVRGPQGRRSTVRYFRTVEAEMRANYVGRITEAVPA